MNFLKKVERLRSNNDLALEDFMYHANDELLTSERPIKKGEIAKILFRDLKFKGLPDSKFEWSFVENTCVQLLSRKNPKVFHHGGTSPFDITIINDTTKKTQRIEIKSVNVTLEYKYLSQFKRKYRRVGNKVHFHCSDWQLTFLREEDYILYVEYYKHEDCIYLSGYAVHPSS